ncbi:hypothetical protein V2W45_1483368 [Cenococcum geophilum]
MTLKLEKKRGKALSFKLLFLLFVYIFATLSAINAVSIYNPKALSPYDSYLSANILGNSILLPTNAQEKRKGGGGKSGGGGRGGKSSGGGASNLKPNLNARGKTVFGLGVRPAYNRGRYYSGGRSPFGLAPLLIPPIAALTIFPSLWLYGTVTNTTFPNGINQTLFINCLCQRYSIYSCNDNSDNTYLYNLIRNGSYAALNKTLITISIVNKTRIIAINGILLNSTTMSGGLDLPAPN